MSDHDLPRDNCPHCGKEFTGHMNASGEEPPKPGDASICIVCANLSIFDATLRLRKPTDEEKREALDDPLFARATSAVLRLRKIN